MAEATTSADIPSRKAAFKPKAKSMPFKRGMVKPKKGK